MKFGFQQEHLLDANGEPAGGASVGNRFNIYWQNGPLVVDGERLIPNGAFVEDVLDAVIGRIEFYQSTKFACDENARALLFLRSAALSLDARTKRRESQGVEGTHQGS